MDGRKWEAVSSLLEWELTGKQGNTVTTIQVVVYESWRNQCEFVWCLIWIQMVTHRNIDK